MYTVLVDSSQVTLLIVKKIVAGLSTLRKIRGLTSLAIIRYAEGNPQKMISVNPKAFTCPKSSSPLVFFRSKGICIMKDMFKRCI